jgi:hypothetical protein
MHMRIRRLVAAAAILLPATIPAQAPRFEVSFPASAKAGPITGRLVIMISKTQQPEPRLLLGLRGPAMVAVDIDQLKPDQAAVVDSTAIAYPSKLSDLPAGEYVAQAVINVYEHVRRSDGHTIWVPMNDGTIEFFTVRGGNLYSAAQKVRLGAGGVVKLVASNVIPKAERPKDTEWIKHLSIQSKKLTAFWGRPIFVHASVLLPKGYAEHPTSYYPSIYTLGHNTTPLSFTTNPPPAGRGAGVSVATGLEHPYETFKAWTGDDYPRVIAISLMQQTPYFPDSYSVNSANNGPYGDAIVEEVIPYLEEKFRIIRKPYARQLEGASTSGWQSLAMQLQHPDFFGGAWVLQPDPIDFTRYGMVNIYADSNAFVVPSGQFMTTERGFQRTPDGQGLYSMRELSLFEAVLGSKGRAGYQLEAWEAIYGPVGPDGYPVPLWDKITGKIDPAVATYMRDHGYDLRAYAEKNWSTLGPKLAGKLHFFAGDMDDYWLNLAVYKFEDFLKGTTNPKSDADFTYGRPMKGHSWHAWTWAEFVRRYAATVKANAPAGEDTRQWNY